MKILVLHNAYRQPGGEDAAVARETGLLRAHGHEVFVHERRNEAIGGLRAATAGLRAPYSAAARDEVAAVIRSCRPDVVHAHNLFPLLTPSIYDAAAAAGVPVVQTLHNYRLVCPAGTLLRDGRPCELCVRGSAYQAVRYGCYRRSRLGSLAVARMVERHRAAGTWAAKVDRFVALTAFARAKLIEGGLPGDRIAIAGNFAPDPGPSPDGGRRGLLYVGRLSEEKGIRALLAAVGTAGVPVRIAGDGPLEPLVRTAPAMTALGRLAPDEVGAEMRSAAALVLPSLAYEGFPLVLVEAFAHGLPVIASGHGSLAELVEDGVTGWHVPPGDAQALAAAMRVVVEHPDDAAARGRAARSAYLARHAPEVAYARLAAIYGEVSR